MPFDKKNKPVILIFIACYLPGYKYGGPIRTIKYMVENLSDLFVFKIITLDHDSSDNRPYQNVKLNAWNKLGDADIYYAAPDTLTLLNISRLIKSTPHDILYLNSFFDFKFTILPLLAKKLKLFPKKPIVLAPRGEFSAGALSLKPFKKRFYLLIARMIGLYQGIHWQASSEHEVRDIKKNLGIVSTNIKVAPNLSASREKFLLNKKQQHNSKESLRVIFLSRITPKKNLDFALKIVSLVTIPLEFHIYGPIEDVAYWQYCQKILRTIPKNAYVRYKGAINPDKVPAILSNYDLFFLPTKGENFGHVISESLMSGTPVLVANTTPWRNLEKAGVGWDLPLNEKDNFVKCIEYCFHLNHTYYMEWRDKIQEFAFDCIYNSKTIDSNYRLFLDILETISKFKDIRS